MASAAARPRSRRLPSRAVSLGNNLTHVPHSTMPARRCGRPRHEAPIRHRSSQRSLQLYPQARRRPRPSQRKKAPRARSGCSASLCLKQLPDLGGIERAAGFGEFDQLTGEDLKPYAPQVPTREAARLALSRSRRAVHSDRRASQARRRIQEEMPAFAKATNTTCALHVPEAKTARRSPLGAIDAAPWARCR